MVNLIRSKKTRRVGYVLVSPELILKWLQFENGKILDVTIDLNQGMPRFLIEHDEMPEMHYGDHIPPATPEYDVTYNSRARHDKWVRRPLK